MERLYWHFVNDPGHLGLDFFGSPYQRTGSHNIPVIIRYDKYMDVWWLGFKNYGSYCRAWGFY